MAVFAKKQVIVIGGNAAGMTAASRLKRLAPDTEISVFERSRFISYSICGAPYFIEGLVKNEKDLLALTPESARSERHLNVRSECEILEIFPSRREVQVRDRRTQLI